MAGVDAVDASPSSETRGRPRIREDHEILAAALSAFANQGYDAMSLRGLNARLGLSHGTISQRFGTKERLYFAAVDLGFATFVAEVSSRREVLLAGVDRSDDLELLRATIRAFLDVSRGRPEIGRLIHQEGILRTVRLQHIIDTMIVPFIITLADPLDRLRSQGRVRPITGRALFFLATNGAEAPYTMTALSAAFDEVDGPFDPESHAEAITEVIMRGITI